MITKAGRPQANKLFREVVPGSTFQVVWKGKTGDYLTSDLARADPESGQPWDYRGAINLLTGEIIWLAATHVIAPTDMKAGPS